jgi:hypothetical protein
LSLSPNEAKPGREQLTLVRVFEVLRGLGYEGGYDAVRRYETATGIAPFLRFRWVLSGTRHSSLPRRFMRRNRVSDDLAPRYPSFANADAQ